MDKKKNKIKILVVVIVIIVLIAGVIGYMIFKDLKQEKVLRDEIATISEKDIAKDRYNTNIKTTKDYAVVEKAIKEYMDDYAVALQDVLKIMDEKQFSNVLSADNYKKDGPDFVKTKEYLAKTKSDFNDKLDDLSDMTSEKTIMKKIESKGLDSYYVGLYKELMLNGVAESDFEASKTDLKVASDKINNVLNVQEEVINLLLANKGKWSVQNDKIVFQDINAVNQYNNLIAKLG